MMNTTPVTELANALSNNLDGALTGLDFIHTLRDIDSQIFIGYEEYCGLFGDRNIDACTKSSNVLNSFFQRSASGSRVGVVFTGCGTSGRLAYLISKRYNSLMSFANIPECFYYLISGGDSAILLSDELPEDDPILGEKNLNDLIVKHQLEYVYVIGVTCGLSAPYVSGQIEYVMNHKEGGSKYGCAILGFNPVELSRNVKIEKSLTGKSVRDVVLELEQISNVGDERSKWFSVLNPVIGPEPIAGSSRMKGGSATAVVLDTICYVALEHYLGSSHKPDIKNRIVEVFHQYQDIHSQTYYSSRDIARAMSMCGHALRGGGHLYYLGTDNAGCMAIIDASEMPDTYGSPFDETRGFLQDGWRTMGNVEGDISHLSGLHRIHIDHFREDILPHLNGNDILVILSSSRNQLVNENIDNNGTYHTSSGIATGIIQLVQDVISHGIDKPQITTIVTSYVIPSPTEIMAGSAGDVNEVKFPFSNEMSYNIQISLNLKTSERNRMAYHNDNFQSFALKLILNAISTYSQAYGKGTVYKGYMVNVSPTNSKIYYRCIQLIEKLINVSDTEAKLALLKSIYKTNSITGDVMALVDSVHIQHATPREEDKCVKQIILPVAFLLATNQFTYSSACKMLLKESNISVILQNIGQSHVANEHNCLFDRATVQVVIGIDLGGTNIRVGLLQLPDYSLIGSIHSDKIITPLDEQLITTNEESESEQMLHIKDPRSFQNVMTKIQHLMVDALQSIISPSPDKEEIIVHRVVAVGLAQPGRVHPNNGISSLSNFSNWGSEPLYPREYICKALEEVRGSYSIATAPEPLFHVVEDAYASLVAEMYLYSHSHPAHQSLNEETGNKGQHEKAIHCLVTIGTGVGTSLSLSTGDLYTGSNGIIEGGHSILVPNGRLCNCGQRGCVEAYISGTAILNRVKAFLQLEEDTGASGKASEVPDALSDPFYAKLRAAYETSGVRRKYGGHMDELMSCEDVFVGNNVTVGFSDNNSTNSTNNTADDFVSILQEEFLFYLSFFCINIFRFYNPNVLIICGGMAKSIPRLLDRLKVYIASLRWSIHESERCELVMGHASYSGVLGAAVASVKILNK